MKGPVDDAPVKISISIDKIPTSSKTCLKHFLHSDIVQVFDLYFSPIGSLPSWYFSILNYIFIPKIFFIFLEWFLLANCTVLTVLAAILRSMDFDIPKSHLLITQILKNFKEKTNELNKLHKRIDQGKKT